MTAVLFYIQEHCGWVASGQSMAPLRLYLSEGSPKRLGVPGTGSRPLRVCFRNSAITIRAVELGSWEETLAPLLLDVEQGAWGPPAAPSAPVPSPSAQLLSQALPWLSCCKASIGSFRQGHLHRMDHIVYSQPRVAEGLSTQDWRADPLNTSLPLVESAR